MVTSRLLEAFLACPVKCHLLSKGERPAGTEYSAWAAAREESHRHDGIRKLTSQETSQEIASPGPGLSQRESLGFAIRIERELAGDDTFTADDSVTNPTNPANAYTVPSVSITTRARGPLPRPTRWAPVKDVSSSVLVKGIKQWAAYEEKVGSKKIRTVFKIT